MRLASQKNFSQELIWIFKLSQHSFSIFFEQLVLTKLLISMKQVSLYLAVGVLASLVVCLTVGSLVAYTPTFHIRKAHRKLEIVYPVASCDSLTQVDLTDIGGNGSVITEAQSTSRSNVTVCSVKGMLAPAVLFPSYTPTPNLDTTLFAGRLWRSLWLYYTRLWSF